MLQKGLRTTVLEDTYYIIIVGSELILGMAKKGTRIDTIHDVWCFDNEKEQLEKYNELKK
jgi:hypothetical protein